MSYSNSNLTPDDNRMFANKMIATRSLPATLTSEDSKASNLLIMVFVLVVMVLVIFFLTDSAYLSTNSYPTIILVLFLCLMATKAVLLPSYKIWYPLALIGGLLIGGWLVRDTLVSTARNGAALLAVVLLADAAYTGYMIKTAAPSTSKMMTYTGYGSVILSVVLALIFGYAVL